MRQAIISDSSTPARHKGHQSDTSALFDIIGFNLRLAHGAVYRHFSENFSELGLTQKQVSILWLAAEHERIGQTRVASILQMDRATTTSLVNRLEAKALLERVTDPADGRKVDLVVTDAGARMLTRARAAIAQHEAWLRDRYSEAEARTLLKLLARLHERD